MSATPACAGDEIMDAPETARSQPADARGGPAPIDDRDAVAALDGVRIALTEVGDGGSYVWHRRDGRLSGMAQAIGSYRDAFGQPCRHLIVMLDTFGRSARIEGVACRSSTGIWHLDG